VAWMSRRHPTQCSTVLHRQEAGDEPSYSCTDASHAWVPRPGGRAGTEDRGSVSSILVDAHYLDFRVNVQDFHRIGALRTPWERLLKRLRLTQALHLGIVGRRGLFSLRDFDRRRMTTRLANDQVEVARSVLSAGHLSALIVH
jgi:hypothetical protein